MDSPRTRFPELDAVSLSEDQLALANKIRSTRRGNLRGPFPAWLRSPELADRLLDVGSYIRFGNSLPGAVKEMAILLTARVWGSDFEWWAHKPIALEAGLSAEVIDAIAKDERPEAMSAECTACYDFVMELHREKRVSDLNFQDALFVFGEQGVVDLIATTGYYTLVSMTLNVAEIRVTE